MCPHSCFLFPDTWTVRTWAAPPSGWEWHWAPLWSPSWASPSTEPLPDWNDLPPAELHFSTTLPSLLKRPNLPAPVLQGSRETFLTPPPRAPPTINFILLSESLDCRIPKKSGNQAITLTLQRPAFSALFSSARLSGKHKEPFTSKQVLLSEGSDAGTLLIISYVSLLRFFTHAVFHKSNLEQCQMAEAGEPKGSMRIVFPRLAGCLSLHRPLEHLAELLFKRGTAVVRRLELICQITNDVAVITQLPSVAREFNVLLLLAEKPCKPLRCAW